MFVYIFICVEKHFANIISKFMWATWLSAGNPKQLEIQKEGIPWLFSGWDSALRALSSIPGQKVRSHEP